MAEAGRMSAVYRLQLTDISVASYQLGGSTQPRRVRLTILKAEAAFTHFVVGKDGAVVALGGLVESDGVVLDVGILSCSATRCFTLRVVCPTLSWPACAASLIE